MKRTPLHPKTQRHSQAGFSLVEMSIALVVVSLGILSVASIFPKQLESVNIQTQKTHMANVAGQTVDVLRLLSADRDIGALSFVQLPTDIDENSGWSSSILLNNTVKEIQYNHPVQSAKFDFKLQYQANLKPIQAGVSWAFEIKLWPAKINTTAVGVTPEVFYTEIHAPGI